MTATYVDPSESDKDAVRFLLGDTNPDRALVSDGEIEFMLTRWMPVYNTIEGVASTVADTIAARFAREANFSADGVSVGLASLAQQFRDLAANLRTQHKNLLVGGLPDVGGITPGEQTSPDIAPFDFGTGMHDNLEAGRQEYGNRPYPEYIAEYQPGA